MAPARRWLRVSPPIAAYLLAAAFAVALADSLLRLPVQVSDSLDAVVTAATAPSAAQLVAETSARSPTTLRPMRYLQVRWLLSAAETVGVSPSFALRAAHAALFAALLFVFVAAAQVCTWRDVAAIVLPLTVLTGLHTFAGMAREAYPVNHYAQVAVGALGVAALARRPPTFASSLAIVATLAYCLLLVESGVLVWVVAVTCFGLRLPGVTRRTVMAATLTLALYAGARVALGISTPGIGAHGTGFGDATYSADEIAARFGGTPARLVLYNLAGATLSVLASEPRAGVYHLLREPRPPVVAINIVSSAAITLLLAWYGWRAWRRRQMSTDDRLATAALVVLLANAVLCAAYIKDEMLGVAGAFYALAAYGAFRALLAAAARVPRPAVTLALATVLALTATLWAFRALGVHYQLRYAGFITRNDWVRVLPPRDPESWPDDPHALAITRSLKDAAIHLPTTSSRFLPAWGDRVWVSE
jgi:hypothetical protein